MKTFIPVFLIALLFSANGCMEPGDVDIYLTNHSNIKLAVFVADGLNSGFSYPDTTLPASLNAFCIRQNIVDTCVIWGSTCGTYERLLSTTQKGILSVYIFNQDTINKYGWTGTFLNDQYIVRYDLSADYFCPPLADISFPPSEKMINVRMWPPYETVLKECAEREAESR